MNVDGSSRRASAGPYAWPFLVHWLGCVPYCDAVQSMRSHTEARRLESPDELWLLWSILPSLRWVRRDAVVTCGTLERFP